MLETLKWISLVVSWLCIAVYIVLFFKTRKLQKELREARSTVHGMMFKLIRENGKHIVFSETDNLCGICQNGGNGCRVSARASCTRFLPLEGTNLTSLNGTVETPPDINYDVFSDLFVDWIESKGWKACTIFKPYQEENEGDVSSEADAH